MSSGALALEYPEPYQPNATAATPMMPATAHLSFADAKYSIEIRFYAYFVDSCDASVT